MTDTSALKKYGDAAVYHDGRGGQFNALVLGTRTDPGVTLGPDGEPVITLLYLDPSRTQNGPLRGDVADAAMIQHDVPYLAGSDLYTVGYNDAFFTYPVPETPTLEERLAAAEAELSALKASIAGSTAGAPTVPVATASGETVAAAVPASSPMSVASQHEAKAVQTDPAASVNRTATTPGSATATNLDEPKQKTPAPDVSLAAPLHAGVAPSTAHVASVGAKS